VEAIVVGWGGNVGDDGEEDGEEDGEVLMCEVDVLFQCALVPVLKCRGVVVVWGVTCCAENCKGEKGLKSNVAEDPFVVVVFMHNRGESRPVKQEDPFVVVIVFVVCFVHNNRRGREGEEVDLLKSNVVEDPLGSRALAAGEDDQETALWVSKRKAGFVETIHQ
jgi:hypothetical protein